MKKNRFQKIKFTFDNSCRATLLPTNFFFIPVTSFVQHKQTRVRLFIGYFAILMLSPLNSYGINIPGVNTQKISNELETLKYHRRVGGTPTFNAFTYTFNVLSSSEYQAQKPKDAFAFESGFVAGDGTINISEPNTTEQLAVFPDLTSVAVFYLNQAYLFHYYQTQQLPLLFKIGFPLFESELLPPDTSIRSAINAYGGSFSSFDVLNNRSTFITYNGMAVAGAFAEFMHIFKNWGYPMITKINTNGFDVVPWWFNVENLAGLLGDFNRYVYHRFLQMDENIRIKMYMETAHFKFYTRPIDGLLNFPFFANVSETAYNEYATQYNVLHGEKVYFFTLPECFDAQIEGTTCGNRVTGGTAWSSGVHSTCAASKDQLIFFEGMCRHELAHSFQGIFPQGTVTSWLNEGFPSFCSDGIITETKLNQIRQSAVEAMNKATTYFGHRPTYEETRIYPSPDYGYYTLGYFFIDYQYRRGGYQLIKDIQINDLLACQSLGYTDTQAFLEDFYFDFDTRVRQLPVVTLQTPQFNATVTTNIVNISWIPLKSNVKLNVYISTDDKQNWTKIADKITSTNCNWNAGDFQTQFYIKILAPDNMDVSTTYGPFQKVNLDKLFLISPTINNYVIASDTTIIKWAITNVQSIQIDYSMNNGTTWTSVSSGVPIATGEYKWVIPVLLSGNCRLKITDFTNSNNFSISDAFTILQPNPVGGPYLPDKNTVLLLHFDNDLNNRNFIAPNAQGNLWDIVSDATVNQELGNCYRTNSVLTVPQNSSLNLSGDWTIEAWVKFNSFNPNNNMYLVWKPGDADMYQSNYSLEVNPWWSNVFFGYFFSALNSRIGVTSTSISINQWYHVAFIRDHQNSKIKIIVRDRNRNQISYREQTYSQPNMLVSSRDLQIGVNFDGYIDEVRISNIARSFTSTGLENPNLQLKMVYPNPSTGIIFLNCQSGKGTVHVLDINGRLLKSEAFIDESPLKLNLSNLKDGVYFIQLKQNKITITNKLILSKGLK